eukprot:TRINITY_DN821_c0_g2_i2.p1 TRINITY_DN821_c0_g2~~TRINITY_DN821_c0_g2_i2.p1  ORF type:complete len:962 (+),score=157.30 TRINITY_DN821_c0_g2_i2:184-3069(+)
MVLLTRGRSQERAGAKKATGRDIVAGGRVAVLSGRHFPAFSAGDEGLVIRVDAEAQNCEVRFDGRADPVPVALRHLRALPTVAASAGSGGSACGAAAALAAAACAAGVGAGATGGATGYGKADEVSVVDEESFGNPSRGDQAWSALASLVRGAEDVQEDAATATASGPASPFLPGEEAGVRPLPVGAFPHVHSFDPLKEAQSADASSLPTGCGLLDSTASFAAGFAAVKDGASTRTGGNSSDGSSPNYGARCVAFEQQQQRVHATPQPRLVNGAMVGVDLTRDGRPDLIVVGPDRDGDGVPDVLQQAAPANFVRGAVVGVDVTRNGQADVLVAGPDLRGDGIPDALIQESGLCGGPCAMPQSRSVAAPAVHLGAAHAHPMTAWRSNSAAAMEPVAVAATSTAGGGGAMAPPGGVAAVTSTPPLPLGMPGHGPNLSCASLGPSLPMQADPRLGAQPVPQHVHAQPQSQSQPQPQSQLSQPHLHPPAPRVMSPAPFQRHAPVCDTLLNSVASDSTRWGLHSARGTPPPPPRWPAGVPLAPHNQMQVSMQQALFDGQCVGQHPHEASWRGSRLEALECRLASFQDEHRAEVMSLRHALEECVRAIGTCARAIDTMCFEEAHGGSGGATSGSYPSACRVLNGGGVCDGQQGYRENFTEWERAATALHDAAELGLRALSFSSEAGAARAAGASASAPCAADVSAPVDAAAALAAGGAFGGCDVSGCDGLARYGAGASSYGCGCGSRGTSRPASAGERRPPSRASSCSGLRRAAGGYGVGGGSVSMPVEVVSSGRGGGAADLRQQFGQTCRADEIAGAGDGGFGSACGSARGASRRARSGSPSSGMLGAGQRRFLVATPGGCGLPGFPPLASPNLAEPAAFCQGAQQPPVSSPYMAGASPHLCNGHIGHGGAPAGSQGAQLLMPPGNLLGSISGLPILPLVGAGLPAAPVDPYSQQPQQPLGMSFQG